MWRATVLTIFPEMFPGPLGLSLAGKALAAGLWSLDAQDIRAHATDKHGTVDDTPAGGGPGMVMKADVLARAIDAVPADGRPRLLMSARGRPLTQARVAELAKGDGLVPVVVQDAATLQVLTLAYMDRAALDETMSSGEATFFSRSRGGRWR